MNQKKTNKKGRHELKYFINMADYLQLHMRLPVVLKKDKNALRNGSYSIRSLYFDNFQDKALNEKLDGLQTREKFRLRFYNNSIDFIRLEKKSKKNNLCFKESVKITKEECNAIINCDFDFLCKTKKELLQELYSKMKCQLLRPKNIVEYKREAYVFGAGNVRITIDTNVSSSLFVKEFLSKNLVTKPVIFEEFIRPMILEVKYDDFLPEIVKKILAINPRNLTSCSKYAITRLI